MFVWIPKKTDERSLTLKSFEKIMRNKFIRNPLGEIEYVAHSVVNSEHWTKKVPNSYWLLMVKDVIPTSIGMPYKDQKELIRKKFTTSSYDVPKTIEVVVGISVDYFKFGRFPFRGDRYQYVRCQERTWIKQVSVGNVTEEGLYVSATLESPSIGVLAKRLY